MSNGLLPMKNRSNILQLAVGKKCFRASRSIGSCLLLEFGKQIRYLNHKNQKRTKGEYGLLIEMGEWILSKQDAQILSSESDIQKIDTNIHILEDKSITNISLNKKGDLEISFDTAYSLQIPFNSSETDLWIFFTPSVSYWLDQRGRWQQEERK